MKITGGAASTEVAWNTGNGSMGFVFVTANDRTPVLVATSSEGSRVISWIRTASYIFELYGDAERHTLLATATVSGVVTEPTTPPRNGFLHGELRWLLIAVPVTVLHVGVYLSSLGPVRTKFPLERASSPRPLHVTPNLLFPYFWRSPKNALSSFDRLALQPARIQVSAYVCAFLALELFPATGQVPFVYFQF